MMYKEEYEYINTNLEITQALANQFQTNSSNQNHKESFLKHKNEIENTSVIDLLPQHSGAPYNSTIT